MCNKKWIRSLDSSVTDQTETTALTSLYLRFLAYNPAQTLYQGLQAVTYENRDTKLVEIKGHIEKPCRLEILQEAETFWLMFQLLGKSRCMASAADPLGSMHYKGYLQPGGVFTLEIDHSKSWLLLIGINGETLTALKQEYSAVQHKHGTTGNNAGTARLVHSISYQHKRVLDSLQQIERTPYSTPIHLSYEISRLFHLYEKDFQSPSKRQEPAEISLYHRAVAYIQTHYMDADLDRQRIADALHISLRSLNRLFESRNTKMSSAIQIARLYKARDLLRTSSLSVEEIAFKFHFSDGKHFCKAYSYLFQCKPTDERKLRKDVSFD